MRRTDQSIGLSWLQHPTLPRTVTARWRRMTANLNQSDSSLSWHGGLANIAVTVVLTSQEPASVTVCNLSRTLQVQVHSESELDSERAWVASYHCSTEFERHLVEACIRVPSLRFKFSDDGCHSFPSQVMWRFWNLIRVILHFLVRHGDSDFAARPPARARCLARPGSPGCQ